MESAVEVLSTSLQYEVVKRANCICFSISLAVLKPSEALYDAFLLANAVVYLSLPIKTLVIICELLDNQFVTLWTCMLVPLWKMFNT